MASTAINQLNAVPQVLPCVDSPFATDSVPITSPSFGPAPTPPGFDSVPSMDKRSGGVLRPAASSSLHVGNLRLNVDEATLWAVFNEIGPVASIRLCRDAFTHFSLGYAYVNYFDVGHGEEALLKQPLIAGRSCRITTVRSKVFINNLAEWIDTKAIHDTFAAFGNILFSKVVTDENGKSKGYGFVCYETREAAKAAINSVNDSVLGGKRIKVAHHTSWKGGRSFLIELPESSLMSIII
ncbi:hypothetical protein HGRIS_001171 [Hohenbuehelia grisea]|uniref:RRM domain-containing protein n=1 Tax=Hohenbuehelia grisea TaxID=104357 RepID=A0ABR3JP29_9AGAR